MKIDFRGSLIGLVAFSNEVWYNKYIYNIGENL